MPRVRLQASKIDPDLAALADAKGLRLTTAKVAGERLFFIRRGETLLLDGQSVTRKELVEILKCRSTV